MNVLVQFALVFVSKLSSAGNDCAVSPGTGPPGVEVTSTHEPVSTRASTPSVQPEARMLFHATTEPPKRPTFARESTGLMRVAVALKLPRTRKIRLSIPGMVEAVVVGSVRRTFRFTVARVCPAVKFWIGPPLVEVCQVEPSTFASTSKASLLPISPEKCRHQPTQFPYVP